MPRNPFARTCVQCTKDIGMGRPCFLRNATSCVMGRGGSESAQKMEDTPESTSLRQRQKLKREKSNQRSTERQMGKAGLANPGALAICCLLPERFFPKR